MVFSNSTVTNNNLVTALLKSIDIILILLLAYINFGDFLVTR